MALSKKDFEAIARSVNSTYNALPHPAAQTSKEVAELVIHAVARGLGKTNPQFSNARFVDACTCTKESNNDRLNQPDET